VIYGAEVMLEIARFWASMCVMNENSGRYDISNVMGPDEFHEKYPDSDVDDAGVKNNAYTNIMVSWLLEKSIKLIEEILPKERVRELRENIGITDEEIKKWKNITKKLTVVFHDDLVISQFEGYDKLKELDWDAYRSKYNNIGRIDLILKSEGDSSDNYKLAKQADTVMLFYLLSHDEVLEILQNLGYPYSVDLIYKTIRYYFDRCTHGSTLSLVVYSYVLFQFDPEEAWHMYKQFVASDIVDVQGGSSAEGIHIVPMAASYNMLYYQVCGIETKDNTVSLNPRLPNEMTYIKTQYTYNGRVLRLEITKDELKVKVLASADLKPMHIVYGKHKMTLKVGASAQFTIDERLQEKQVDKCSKDLYSKLKLPNVKNTHEEAATK